MRSAIVPRIDAAAPELSRVIAWAMVATLTPCWSAAETIEYTRPASSIRRDGMVGTHRSTEQCRSIGWPTLAVVPIEIGDEVERWIVENRFHHGGRERRRLFITDLSQCRDAVEVRSARLK